MQSLCYYLSFLSACLDLSFLGERPGCCWVQFEHSDVLAVQERLVALWRVSGLRPREWRGLFWRSVFHTHVKGSTRCVAHTCETWLSPEPRWYSLWPCDGGPCSEPGRLFLLQHREGVPLHRHRWIRSKIQPHQVWVWLPGRLPLIALQI